MNRAEREEPVDIEFDHIIHRTERAILFKIEGSDEWIAKSLIENLPDVEDCDMAEPGEVTVPRWLAVDRGWEDEE